VPGHAQAAVELPTDRRLGEASGPRQPNLAKATCFEWVLGRLSVIVLASEQSRLPVVSIMGSGARRSIRRTRRRDASAWSTTRQGEPATEGGGPRGSDERVPQASDRGFCLRAALWRTPGW
jgi:hypothetical protein